MFFSDCNERWRHISLALGYRHFWNKWMWSWVSCILFSLFLKIPKLYWDERKFVKIALQNIIKTKKNWWFLWNNEKIKWKCQYLILSSKSNLFNNNFIGSWNQCERIRCWDFFSLFYKNHQFFMIFLYGGLFQQFFLFQYHLGILEKNKMKCMH